MNQTSPFLGSVERNVARAQLQDVARHALRLRRIRAEIFGAAITKEVAWDILLVLYTIDRRLTIGRLTRLIGASATTVLRWLDYLETSHLVERRDHPLDARSRFVELTNHGENLLERYLASHGND